MPSRGVSVVSSRASPPEESWSVRRAAAVVAWVLALAGCTTVRSESNCIPGTDFANLQSFAQTLASILARYPPAPGGE